MSLSPSPASPTAPRGQVAVRKVRVVLSIAARAGLDRAALLAAIGLTEAEVADPDGWVPQRAWRDVWLAVVHHTGDEAVGLRAAQEIDPGYFGVIDYAARSATDLGAAIPVAARYFRLANSWGRMELRDSPDGLRVSRHILGDELGWLPPQAADFALATMVRVIRLAAARPPPLRQVCLRRAAPADPEPWRNFFACDLRFSAAEDAVELPRAALAIPMRAPDPRLAALVESYASALLAELAAPEAPLALRVRQQVAAALAARRRCDLDTTARHLGLSGRTLQRRLAAEGTSWAHLADEVREGPARQWLRAGLSPGEVAFLLGYSEVSAFHRAFQGWTGTTPGAWARADASGQADGARHQGARPVGGEE